MYCKPGKRIEETDGAEGEQKTTSKTEQRQPEQGILDTPVRDPPRDHASHEPGREDQEDCRAEDSPDLSNHRLK